MAAIADIEIARSAACPPTAAPSARPCGSARRGNGCAPRRGGRARPALRRARQRRFRRRRAAPLRPSRPSKAMPSSAITTLAISAARIGRIPPSIAPHFLSAARRPSRSSPAGRGWGEGLLRAADRAAPSDRTGSDRAPRTARSETRTVLRDSLCGRHSISRSATTMRRRLRAIAADIAAVAQILRPRARIAVEAPQHLGDVAVDIMDDRRRQRGPCAPASDIAGWTRWSPHCLAPLRKSAACADRPKDAPQPQRTRRSPM